MALPLPREYRYCRHPAVDPPTSPRRSPRLGAFSLGQLVATRALDLSRRAARKRESLRGNNALRRHRTCRHDRCDEVVSMSTLLTNILQCLSRVPSSGPLLSPRTSSSSVVCHRAGLLARSPLTYPDIPCSVLLSFCFSKHSYHLAHIPLQPFEKVYDTILRYTIRYDTFWAVLWGLREGKEKVASSYTISIFVMWRPLRPSAVVWLMDYPLCDLTFFTFLRFCVCKRRSATVFVVDMSDERRATSHGETTRRVMKVAFSGSSSFSVCGSLVEEGSRDAGPDWAAKEREEEFASASASAYSVCSA